MSRLKGKQINKHHGKRKTILNKCEGCAQNLPIRNGETSKAKIHFLNGEPYMVCTKELYQEVSRLYRSNGLGS